MRGSHFRGRCWVQSEVSTAETLARPQGDQPGPRCQLSLLKSVYSSKTEDPLKITEKEVQLLHPSSSTKQRGGNRFHISHKHRSDGDSQECTSPQRADNDYRGTELLLNLNPRRECATQNAGAGGPDREAAVLPVSKRLFKK